MARSRISDSVAGGSIEAQVWERSPTPDELKTWVALWEPWVRGRRILDVGCGEGHNLEAFSAVGYAIEGVELNSRLAALSRSRGFVVHEQDAAAFVADQGARFEAFLLIDVIEHLQPSEAEGLLTSLPHGAIVIIQTPNTNSVVGHQFYLQVPSHVVPYSPVVLRRLLERTGNELLSTGTLYGGLPWAGVRRRITEFILVKLLGTVTTRLLVEGANYYVVARKR